MSYYILPRNNNNIDINPILNNKKNNIITSYSIYNYYYDATEQLLKIFSNNYNDISCNNNIEQIYKEFNPYEYIFSKVPGSQYSVSKLKTNTNLFYEFLEISNTLNCFDSFKNVNLKFIYIGNNCKDIFECFSLLRENNNDELVQYNESIKEKFDFLFCEMLPLNNHFDMNDYILHFVKNIIKILKHQLKNGICIIQINHVIHKPIIDLLYLLTSLYEKTYIIKPNSSNIIGFDKYLVCKNFIYTDNKEEIYTKYYDKLNEFILNYEKEKEKETKNHNIISIINEKIPYYFMNKIDDINIIIGQQQLECIDQIINMFKNNNNKKERIEYIRKINIQKSVNWCEKFKIPCNKFLEKTNIFLPVIIKEE
jgi:hypothetical protein